MLSNKKRLENLIEQLDPLELKKEAFKRGLFDFIVTQNGKTHYKQRQALKILTDNSTEQFMYGGAAGGSKSWSGCVWLLFMCLIYENTNWFIGRRELKRITQSTLKTFIKVAKHYGFQDEYKYNSQKNFIRFKNGSNIDLLDLAYLPRDPDFERFGSTEYTGGWIEEAPEVDFGAYDVLNTRIGRHLNKPEDHNIKGKLFLTANPQKNWTKKEFYDPFKANDLAEDKKFLPCFATDNPFQTPDYVDRLKKIKDKNKRERLLNGNWEYDDDPTVLCDYDSIRAIFDNYHIEKSKNKYITADIATYGSDKYIIGIWEGWKVVEIQEYSKSGGKSIVNTLRQAQIKYRIPQEHICFDNDGIGSFLGGDSGFFKRAIPFIATSKPIEPIGKSRFLNNEQYENLDAQCQYYLAEKINENKLWIAYDCTEKQKEHIEEELGQMKSRDSDKDGKLKVIRKDEVKKNIGRSPDYRDFLKMRCVFDFRPKKKRKGVRRVN